MLEKSEPPQVKLPEIGGTTGTGAATQHVELLEIMMGVVTGGDFGAATGGVGAATGGTTGEAT